MRGVGGESEVSSDDVVGVGDDGLVVVRNLDQPPHDLSFDLFEELVDKNLFEEIPVGADGIVLLGVDSPRGRVVAALRAVMVASHGGVDVMLVKLYLWLL